VLPAIVVGTGVAVDSQVLGVLASVVVPKAVVVSTGVLWGVVTSVEVVKEVVLTRRVEDGLISPVVG
jgi:hypothetical protein